LDIVFVYVNRTYNTRYKTHIHLHAPIYRKHIGMKSSISMTIELCRLLRINVYNFNIVNDLKSYLNNVDLTLINL